MDGTITLLNKLKRKDSATNIDVGTMVREKVDMNDPRNMIIVSMVLVLAIGGMVVDMGGVAFSGIGLGAIVGIVLNLVLPKGHHIIEE